MTTTLTKTMLDRRFPSKARRAQFDRFVAHVRATAAPCKVTVDPETANEYVLIDLGMTPSEDVAAAIRAKAPIHVREGFGGTPFICYEAEKPCSKKEISAMVARMAKPRHVRAPYAC